MGSGVCGPGFVVRGLGFGGLVGWFGVCGLWFVVRVCGLVWGLGIGVGGEGFGG